MVSSVISAQVAEAVASRKAGEARRAPAAAGAGPGSCACAGIASPPACRVVIVVPPDSLSIGDDAKQLAISRRYHKITTSFTNRLTHGEARTAPCPLRAGRRRAPAFRARRRGARHRAALPHQAGPGGRAPAAVPAVPAHPALGGADPGRQRLPARGGRRAGRARARPRTGPARRARRDRPDPGRLRRLGRLHRRDAAGRDRLSPAAPAGRRAGGRAAAGRDPGDARPGPARPRLRAPAGGLPRGHPVGARACRRIRGGPARRLAAGHLRGDPAAPVARCALHGARAGRRHAGGGAARPLRAAGRIASGPAGGGDRARLAGRHGGDRAARRVRLRDAGRRGVPPAGRQAGAFRDRPAVPPARALAGGARLPAPRARGRLKGGSRGQAAPEQGDREAASTPGGRSRLALSPLVRQGAARLSSDDRHAALAAAVS
ncbi:hypothetical protein BGLA2_90026 [Burkholderia gladioli]|nr:hypothetical protein BGLA2_90026 [Burkholderia gladioli]